MVAIPPEDSKHQQGDSACPDHEECQCGCTGVPSGTHMKITRNQGNEYGPGSDEDTGRQRPMSEQHECSQSRVMSDGRLRAQGACPIPFPRGIARDTAFNVPPGDRQAPPAQRRTFTSLRSLETTQRGTDVKLGGRNQRLATEKGYEPVVVMTEQEFRTLEERLHEAEQLYRLCAQEKTELQGKLGRREETINYLHGEIERKDRSIEEYRNVLHQCKSEKKQLLRDLGKSERDVDDLQAQLGYVQKRLDKTDHLLNQRTDELKMADSYLSRTNLHSDTELKEMVEKLNQEISQTSSTIVDALDFNAPDRTMVPMSQRDALLQTLGDSLPLAFVECLSNHRPLSSEVTEDLGVSVAIQATMAACVFDFTQSLCPADRESSIFLENIYRGLCSTDPHAVLRWRAMTRSQIRQTSSAEERNACYQYLEGHLIGLLGICGWTVKHLQRNDQRRNAIIHGLEVITRKALDLNKALLEGRVQGDATLVWLKGGSNFDSARADDSFSRRAGYLVQQKPSQSAVSCTTDLGLQITTTCLDESKVAIMLKAKVILEDTFLERTVDGSNVDLDI